MVRPYHVTHNIAGTSFQEAFLTARGSARQRGLRRLQPASHTFLTAEWFLLAIGSEFRDACSDLLLVATLWTNYVFFGRLI